MLSSGAGIAAEATSHREAPGRANRESVARVANAMPPRQVFASLAELFKALGAESRAMILHALSMEELCVSDLAAVLGATDSAVSHQLRHLRSMRLVRHRREGKMVYYTLDDDHVRQLFGAAMQHVHEQNTGS